MVVDDSTVNVLDPTTGTMLVIRPTVSRRYNPTDLRGRAGVSVGVCGDSVWVASLGDDEITLLTQFGLVVAVRVVKYPPARFPGDIFVLRSWCGDRAVFEEASTSVALRNLSALGHLVLRANSVPRTFDTLAILRDPDGALQIEASDGRVVSSLVPWSRADLFALSPSGQFGTVVWQSYPSTNDSVRISQIGLAPGNNVIDRYFSHRSMPVPKAMVEEYVTGLVNGPFARGFATRALARRAVLEAIHLPRELPPVRAVRVDRLGKVWMRLTEEPEGTWTIIDRQGRRRNVLLPAGFIVGDADAHGVWGLQGIDSERAIVRYISLDNN
jgi:hypothetical protein